MRPFTTLVDGAAASRKHLEQPVIPSSQ
ncbi:MAG: hypothetical protein QOC55_2285, partial [Thermoleophilaceae bacterium]|nr:hypothetical protein [Thermoleophilaceae bacterium]